MLILALPLLGFRPENHLLLYIMPRATSARFSTLRRYLKADRVLRTDYPAMRACDFCISRNVLCVISTGSKHCEQCYRFNRRCELFPPYTKIERLTDKDEKLFKKV
jgi:hypothetical protein